jgi:L-malate glycosyltransferase
MKIALYVTAWPPGEYASGTVTYASRLVPALRKLGHEVFILTFNLTETATDPYAIDLRRFASRTLWTRAMLRLNPVRAGYKEMAFVIASALRELIDKHAIEVFETEEAFGLSYSVARMNLLPVVVRIHGPWFLNGGLTSPHNLAENRRREKVEGKGIYSADFVTIPSSNILASIEKYYRSPLKRRSVIRNPIETPAQKGTWDINTCDINKILFVGRFDRLKGGDLVLRAFAELAASNPQLTLTFAGPDVGVRGANGSILSFREFVQSSVPAGYHDRIDFRGMMNQSDIAFLRKKHFLTVVASQQEVLPYTVLEAMSLGCPLVATAVGGIAEIVVDGQNGLLVPSQDVKAMVAACQALLDDHAVAARLGRQAWQDCAENCGPNDIADETLVAYQMAINNFSSRRD